MANMKQFGTVNEEMKKRPKAAAFGIGGAGRNIISSFDRDKFSNVEIYEVGELNRLKDFPSIKIQKKDLENAFNSGLSNRVREKTSSEKILSEKIKDFDILYFLCGLGGDIGSWTTTICCEISKNSSVFTAALFTTPFKNENPSRVEFASDTKSKIHGLADISVEFSNNKLLEINPYLSLKKAFSAMNNIISIPIEDINSVITKGDIPLLKNICGRSYDFSVGVGYGKGREKGKRAVNKALRSPWLERNYHNSMIAVITKGKKGSDMDVEDILDKLASEYSGADILYGIREDESIENRIRVTLLAGKERD